MEEEEEKERNVAASDPPSRLMMCTPVLRKSIWRPAGDGNYVSPRERQTNILLLRHPLPDERVRLTGMKRQ